MVFRLLLLVYAGFLMMPAACSQHNTSATRLSGQISLRSGWQNRLYLVKPQYYKQLCSPYEGTVVDSADIRPDGSFDFRDLSWLKGKGLYLLFIQPTGSRFPTAIAEPLPAENYACLVLAPGTAIRLVADAGALARSYKLEAADPETRMLAQLRDGREALYRSFETAQAAPAEDEETFHGNTPGQADAYGAFDAFLDTTHAFLPTFVALRWRAPENEFRDRPEFFLRVLERLQKSAAQHPWVSQLGVLLNRDKLPVLTGEKMPAFALPTPEGDTLRLESVSAKLLLVDFWASWCAPCRKENRATIRPLYDQYHAKGFQVLGVSIDRSREAWTAAIRKDGAIWPNVSDLLGDPSPVRQSLKFEYIPSNYLLDAEGRLLARNLHGDALRAFVEKYLGPQ